MKIFYGNFMFTEYTYHCFSISNYVDSKGQCIDLLTNKYVDIVNNHNLCWKDYKFSHPRHSWWRNFMCPSLPSFRVEARYRHFAHNKCLNVLIRQTTLQLLQRMTCRSMWLWLLLLLHYLKTSTFYTFIILYYSLKAKDS